MTDLILSFHQADGRAWESWELGQLQIQGFIQTITWQAWN